MWINSYIVQVAVDKINQILRQVVGLRKSKMRCREKNMCVFKLPVA